MKTVHSEVGRLKLLYTFVRKHGKGNRITVSRVSALEGLY
jgi:hypothetical protein